MTGRMLKNRVTLIGYRACGKSTVARLVADRLGWPEVDADRSLEKRQRTSIAKLVARAGLEVFREREAAELVRLLAGEGPLVLATGGGAVLRPENRALLRERGGCIVYLHAEAAVLQARLARDPGNRPSLTGATITDEVPRLLAEREPLYREIAHAVVAATQPVDAVAAQIVALVQSPS